MSERDLQNRILAALSREGARVWAHDTGTAIAPSVLSYRIKQEDVGKTVGQAVPPQLARRISFGRVGSSDIIGVLPSGQFVGIEVKLPGNDQRPEQQRFQAAIEKVGGLYVLAYSVDDAVSAVRAALEETAA